MRFYNSLSLKKDEFLPLEPQKVRMYACGPTVYNYVHIGNARQMVVFDALRRYLEYRGYDVTYVQNFTDIDDKIINRANEENVTQRDVAERFIAEYWTDARGLNVLSATHHPKATETVGEIIAMVQTLVDKGYAYESNGDVYFRTEKFGGYAKLSHQPLDALQAGARIDISEIKEDAMDFALWKSAKPGEPFWDSPWGNGRPGWHIECSAMAKKFLGDTIDIHAGGTDIMFPHHENEIAQSEAANGCEFARFWLHNGMINVENRKMSKSLGNFTTVRDAAAAFGYENIRMFILMSHYRSPINYSGAILEQSKAALTRFKTARENFAFLARNGGDSPADAERAFVDALGTYRDRFIEAMDDDFNTADGISVIFELVRDANTRFADGAARESADAVLKLFDELTGVLGLLYGAEASGVDEARVEALIAERTTARAEKNWQRSDEIRDELKSMGVTIEDTKQGTRWQLTIDN